MYINSRALGVSAASLLLLGRPARAGTACPLLGAYYPAPTDFGAGCGIQSAVLKAQSDLQAAFDNGTLDNALTAFSVDVYSLHNDTSLFTAHYLPDELASQHTVGVSALDSNTVFRVGSLSKLLTAYLYLAKAGDVTWNRPVTDFIPELAALAQENDGQDSINNIAWEDITIGALASHMAGLGRDAAFSYVLQETLEGYGLVNTNGTSHSTCGDPAKALIPCNRTQFFEDFGTRHPVSGPFYTPAYSNAGYQIFGYAIENITGMSMEDLFQQELVDALGLTGTYYKVPDSDDDGFIPFNATYSWWDTDILDETPAGGYYSSINDMRAIGKSLLNYTLISQAQTRRWMKPDTFTSNNDMAVGAPWEIVRAPGGPASWMYGKSGDVGLYSSMFLVIPELAVGISILGAGEASSAGVRAIGDIVANDLVPALWAEAARETEATYAGTYADAATNSTIVAATDADGPGLVVSEWTLGGADVFALFGSLVGAVPSVRLYPMGLRTSAADGTTRSAWRAIFDTESGGIGPISTSCGTWFLVNQLTFGGVGLDEFVFTLDSTGQSAVSLEPVFTLDDLPKAANLTRRR